MQTTKKRRKTTCKHPKRQIASGIRFRGPRTGPIFIIGCDSCKKTYETSRATYNRAAPLSRNQEP
jgi:hypothetical protein